MTTTFTRPRRRPPSFRLPWPVPDLRETKALLVLVVPMIGASLATMGMSITDTLMMSRIGPTALAAGAVVSDLYSLVFYLAAGGRLLDARHPNRGVARLRVEPWGLRNMVRSRCRRPRLGGAAEFPPVPDRTASAQNHAFLRNPKHSSSHLSDFGVNCERSIVHDVVHATARCNIRRLRREADVEFEDAEAALGAI